jgi:hypothetical protein
MDIVHAFVILRCQSCRSADVWLVQGSNIEPHGRKIYGFFASCKACGHRPHLKYSAELKKIYESQHWQKKHQPVIAGCDLKI